MSSSDLPLSPLARSWIETPANPLAATLHRFRAEGRPYLDLITANPHENGLRFSESILADALDRALDAPNVRVYKPDPLGQRPAREAIAAWYERRQYPADPDHIVLTPGTSLAYFYAFRLLVEPGGEILVPRPGYPLFDDIAATAGIRLRYYHLRHEGDRWRPDLDDLTFQCTPATRLIIVVSPHNPVGTVFSEAELEGLGRLCRARRLPVVFDEVFSEFLAPPLAHLPRPQPGQFPLVLTLNGLSKMFSLPGWKAGWIKIEGTADNLIAFLRSLEFLTDTFLPVPEPIQALIPALLEAGEPESETLAREYNRRRRLALETLPFSADRPEGGVYLCCRLPEPLEEDTFCLHSLRKQDVLVHPGYYYHLPPGYVVLTCIPEPDRLREGIARLREAASDLQS
jgi:aspartate/methionine/tyrosine aminotransferase